jgi:hypothetical protein
MVFLNFGFAYFILVHKWLGEVGRSLSDASILLGSASASDVVVHTQTLLRDLPAQLGLIGALYLIGHSAMLLLLALAFLVCVRSLLRGNCAGPN